MFLVTRFLLITIYFLLLHLFAVFIYYLHYADFFLCYDCEEVDPPQKVFDYIIVGCGSAGAIVARRLAEDRTKTVLVLEAGKYGHKFLDIPVLGVLLQKTHFDWQYTTVPQSNACLALNNNASIWPMGKIIGGTGMVNNMIYVRGHPEDFNEWFENKEEYNFKDYILPYFNKLEKWSLSDPYQRSVFVSNLAFNSSLPEFILNAARRLGFKITENTENCEKGFGMPKATILNGSRFTPSHNFINSNKPNLLLRTDRIVEKILFHDNFEAYGVQYSYLDKHYFVRASKGIILSAGVVGTPKILLHSGLGPKSHLDEMNITLKVNLPVGENLQDHVATGFDLILLNKSLGIGIEQMLSPFSAFKYLWSGSGPWTSGGCETLAFLDTNSDSFHQKSHVQPDLQFMVMPLSINEDNGVHLRHLIGITDHTWNNYFAAWNQTAITILPVLLHPKSRGTLRLKDSNFKSKPLINPNYLSHEDDVRVLLKAINLIEKLADTEEMKMLGAKFNDKVFPGCDNHSFGSEIYWECYVRHLTLTAYHPVGTCKMGSNKDSTSVVNYNFEVKGTNNLFVVDGSVIPKLTSGNINGAILMLAEMASDLLKLRNFLNFGKCKKLEIFIKQSSCRIH